MDSVLNSQISSGKLGILKILNLPIHKIGLSLQKSEFFKCYLVCANFSIQFFSKVIELQIYAYKLLCGVYMSMCVFGNCWKGRVSSFNQHSKGQSNMCETKNIGLWKGESLRIGRNLTVDLHRQ